MATRHRRAQRALGAALLAAGLLLAGAPAAAHDIPSDVTLHAFVKPEAQELRLLVRVPMSALRDVDAPLRPGGTMDLARVEPALRDAASQWLVANLALYESGRALPAPRIERVRVSLPSDRSFSSYAAALAHLDAPPIPPSEQLFWGQSLLDVELRTPIGAPTSRFAIEPTFARLGLKVTIALHVLPPQGAERVFELHGDPGLVELTPLWHEAAWRFVQSGVAHILQGGDHLLFLACLVIPMRRLRPLVVMATAFTLAHSVTLLATAFGFGPQGSWFPPLVETLIAASILWMALANIVGGAAVHTRWAWAFGFGLVHGFGFAFALRESLQFAGDHLVGALLAFNVGIEIGQVAVLVALVPLLNALLRRVPERIGVIVLSALAAHTAWHWMVERAQAWWQYPLPRWQAIAAADAAQALGWLTAALIVGAILWSARGPIGRWSR